MVGREIPLRVIFTRTSPQIPTRNEKMIIDELRTAGIPMLETHLNERAAFKSIFTYRQALDELDPAMVNGIEGALANAYKFVEEVVLVLQKLRETKAAA